MHINSALINWVFYKCSTKRRPSTSDNANFFNTQMLSMYLVCCMLFLLATFMYSGDRRRLLLRGLTQSLPEILPLLYTVHLSPKYYYLITCLLSSIVNVAMLDAVTRKALYSCIE